MNKVIVTGATGFIGQYLVPKLKENGRDVYSIGSSYGNLVEESTWNNLPDCDVLIHLASKVFIPDSWKHPVDFIETNLMGTTRALDYCCKKSCKMVFVSSYVYGNPISLPIRENSTISASNPYGLSKILAEKVCSFYSQNFGVGVTVLRPFNIYGAGQAPVFLIPKVIQQIFNNKEIIVNDLRPKRDYVHVKDLVIAIIKAAELDLKDGVLNIGSGVSHSVEEVICMLQKILGTSLPVKSIDDQRTGEIIETVADISEAKSTLNWEPNYSLMDGLKEMLGKK